VRIHATNYRSNYPNRPISPGTLFASPRGQMKIKIIADPDKKIPELNLSRYEKGCVYEVSGVVGALLVCEGWAEPLPENQVPTPTPIYQK
jgi:hypothetical protein